MFLAVRYRNKDKLIDNPEFDKATMDPTDLNNPDPQLLVRTAEVDTVYIEKDPRAVRRAAGVIEELDFYEIEIASRGNIVLHPVEV